ncbi:MAG TPA: ATP-binding cassette domain-containing protein [bacterium]|nr:ATP-binding cassette domain-containing protein [bacterium]HPN30606.1 ATP-binding cassette domain-containing protein [bacterium]
MIKIENCSKKYGYPVLTNISIEAGTNEFIVLKGDSGTGKTTLLNIIAGTVKPDSGIVEIDGTDIVKLPDSKISEYRNARISYIRQASGLVPWLNVKDNLELPFLISGESSKKKKTITDQTFEFFDLKKIRNQYPEQISGGQYQRTAIASSLIKSQNIILADEPTNNLDKKNLKFILDYFEKNKSMKTIIVVSHIDVFDYLADKIWIIEKEKIVCGRKGTI